MQNSLTSTSPIDDGDIELLEAFLDDELTPAQSQLLRERFASEPGLENELEQLRAERKIRATMYAGLEGGEEAVVDRILAQVSGAKSSGRAGPTTFRLRYAMAAAALIAIGFLVGWMGAMGGKSTVSAGETAYRV